MRLIDADALIAEMSKHSSPVTNNEWLNAVCNAPTVKPKVLACGSGELVEDSDSDVIRIVRCKECKYSEHWYRDKARCFLWAESGIDVFEDGYCSYAEVREDE